MTPPPGPFVPTAGAPPVSRERPVVLLGAPGRTGRAVAAALGLPARRVPPPPAR